MQSSLHTSGALFYASRILSEWHCTYKGAKKVAFLKINDGFRVEMVEGKSIRNYQKQQIIGNGIQAKQASET